MKIFTQRSPIIVLFVMMAIVLSAQTSYTFSGKPMYNIEARRNNVVLGNITIELFPLIAPKHVINFDSLVSFQFYDSTAFHRVIPGFMIQGGDPNSRSGPTSTWGYGQPNQPKVNAEFSTFPHLRGSLSAARSNNINSATSQFFICVAPAPNLDQNYSLYGHVLQGMDVVDTIVSAPRNMTNNMPFQKIEMFITRIGTNDTVPPAPAIIAPAYAARNIGTSTVIKWKEIPGAFKYNLELSTDTFFIDIVGTYTTLAPQYHHTQLQDSTIYYWRVQANDGGTMGAYAYGKFYTIGETTSIPQINNNLPFAVFPNPGTGIFLFNNLVSGSTVTIYDLQGKVIQEIVTEHHSATINIKNCDKGVYLYKIKSPDNQVAEGRLIVQ